MNILHEQMMARAIEEAQKAGQKDEVPVGAVLVGATGDIIASAHNMIITLRDPTAHAEILSLRKAAEIENNYRLLNTTLYVTVEPCIMCMGAIVHARVARVVFGAMDPKWGAAGSLYHFAQDLRLNHHPEIISGVREAECRRMMQAFFRTKRLKT
ncbi:MAG: tRNA adenosine(34) deaminase TadA [Desulfobacterales bacterium]|jgi:tRNA(adenine34) deaminase|nr:tRNA adenosine(34) deaminase TadA [Desulfobacterales bacterium]